MKNEESRKKFITISNIVVIILTVCVIITGISCLAAAEKAKKELADVQSALDELKTSAPLDQYWTENALRKVQEQGGLTEEIKTVFLTCKRDSGGSGGELILVSSDRDYDTLTLDGNGEAVRELDGLMGEYLEANEGKLVVLVSRERFSDEDLSLLEGMLEEKVERFGS